MAKFGEENIAFRFISHVDQDGIACQVNHCADGYFTDLDYRIVVILFKELGKADLIVVVVCCRNGGLCFVFSHGLPFLWSRHDADRLMLPVIRCRVPVNKGLFIRFLHCHAKGKARIYLICLSFYFPCSLNSNKKSHFGQALSCFRPLRTGNIKLIYYQIVF